MASPSLFVDEYPRTRLAFVWLSFEHHVAYGLDSSLWRCFGVDKFEHLCDDKVDHELVIDVNLFEISIYPLFDLFFSR